MKTHCSICDVWLNSQDQYAAHLTGKSHKTKEAGHTPKTAMWQNSNFNQNANRGFTRPPFIGFVPSQETTEAAPTSNAQGTNDNIYGMQVSNPGGNGGSAAAKPPKSAEFFCTVCVVGLTSKAQADMHYEGAKHRKALAAAAASAQPEEPTPEGAKRKRGDICETCKVPLPTQIVAEAHYGGAKHAKKLKLSAKMGQGTPGYPPPQFIQSLAAPQHQAFPYAQASCPFQQQPLFPEPTDVQTKKQSNNTMLHCSFCNISVNSMSQMEAHQQGTKHQNAVKGIATPNKKGPANQNAALSNMANQNAALSNMANQQIDQLHFAPPPPPLLSTPTGYLHHA